MAQQFEGDANVGNAIENNKFVHLIELLKYYFKCKEEIENIINSMTEKDLELLKEYIRETP